MSQDTFGAELQVLWDVGSRMLPDMASLFGTASQVVNSTTSNEQELFKSRVYQPWTALRDELQRILAVNRDTLDDLGSALRMAADSYAASDEYGADELQTPADALAEVQDGLIAQPRVPEGVQPGEFHISSFGFGVGDHDE